MIASHDCNDYRYIRNILRDRRESPLIGIITTVTTSIDTTISSFIYGRLIFAIALRRSQRGTRLVPPIKGREWATAG